VNTTPRRSLADVRTMSGRVSDAEKPQRRYLRLAVLELEKVRRLKERSRSAQRIGELDERLTDIARQQAGLLAETSPSAASPPSDSGFAIRY
jgi:hypothetical protein